MKTILLILLANYAVADPNCLLQATSQELLNEVGRRMTGVTPGPEAMGAYDCDSFGRITLTLVTGSTTASTTVDIGSKCQTLASELSRYRSRIRIAMLAAACDSFGTMHKFYLTPQGDLKLLGTTEMTSQTQCFSQATQINSSR